MINKKTLLLGGAAALFVTGVQAADMPKAPAREPVYRCDITGFIELPGTDICFKVGGHAQVWAAASQDNVIGQSIFHGWKNVGADFIHTRQDTLVMHALGRLNFDARSSTEYGTLRAFIEIQAHDNNASTGGAADLRHAFIQFGNWTFGKTTRTLNPAGVTPYLTEHGVNGTLFAGQGTRPVQVRYTMPLGNGLSLAVAVEDPAHQQSGEYVSGWGRQVSAISGAAFAPPAGTFTAAQERDEVPAFVAQLSWAGSWGGFSIGGGVRQNVYAATAWGAGGAPGAFVGTVSDRDIGWRVDGGLYVNISPAVTLMTRGYYSDGYNGNSTGNIGDIIWSQATNTIAGNVQEWMLMVGGNIHWSPTVKSGIFAAYAEIEPEVTAGTLLAAAPSSLVAIEVFQVMANVFWTPVKNMQFGVEVQYVDVDYNLAGAIPGTDAFTVVFEAKRSF